jgi:hypothetical protein
VAPNAPNRRLPTSKERISENSFVVAAIAVVSTKVEIMGMIEFPSAQYLAGLDIAATQAQTQEYISFSGLGFR